jgi:hypothetical protein
LTTSGEASCDAAHQRSLGMMVAGMHGERLEVGPGPASIPPGSPARGTSRRRRGGAARPGGLFGVTAHLIELLKRLLVSRDLIHMGGRRRPGRPPRRAVRPAYRGASRCSRRTCGPGPDRAIGSWRGWPTTSPGLLAIGARPPPAPVLPRVALSLACTGARMRWRESSWVKSSLSAS